MAKAAAKTTSRTEATKSRAPRAKASSNNHSIEKASEEALQKLQELGIEEQLQHDIQWCLGSYRADNNPVGLVETARKALAVLKNEKEKKTKGVSAKLITDLRKVVNEEV